MIAFEVDLMYVSHTSKFVTFTNNLQIVVKYRMYENRVAISNSK